jgi:hypothetical protein
LTRHYSVHTSVLVFALHIQRMLRCVCLCVCACGGPVSHSSLPSLHRTPVIRLGTQRSTRVSRHQGEMPGAAVRGAWVTRLNSHAVDSPLSTQYTRVHIKHILGVCLCGGFSRVHPLPAPRNPARHSTLHPCPQLSGSALNAPVPCYPAILLLAGRALMMIVLLSLLRHPSLDTVTFACFCPWAGGGVVCSSPCTRASFAR